MSNLVIEIEESERQMMLLALAKLTIERPGWEYACGELADKLKGREMWQEFRRIHGSPQ